MAHAAHAAHPFHSFAASRPIGVRSQGLVTGVPSEVEPREVLLATARVSRLGFRPELLGQTGPTGTPCPSNVPPASLAVQVVASCY